MATDFEQSQSCDRNGSCGLNECKECPFLPIIDRVEDLVGELVIVTGENNVTQTWPALDEISMRG